MIRNSIAYYVEGDEFAATALKLVLNVNEPQSAREARERFIGTARALFRRALGRDMPHEVERLLVSETAGIFRQHGKEVVIAKTTGRGTAWAGMRCHLRYGTAADPDPDT